MLFRSCTNGGIKIEVGVDDNDDGTLQLNEIDQTIFVCDGSDGSDGADGNGSASASTMLTSISAPTLAACDAGGRIMKQGLDNGDGGGTAQNGILESGEVDYTTTFCSNYMIGLIKDVNSIGTSGSYRQGIVFISSVSYFMANDGTSGKELWKGDGTTAGTVMVKDIFSGASSSSLVLAIILGIFTFVDVLGEIGGSGVGLSRILIYTISVALAALFATWVISTVLLLGTFKKSPATAILSIISSLLILSVVRKFGGFILIEANWDVVWANRVNLTIGPFFTSGVTQPNISNETWRLWPTIYLVAILIGATYGTLKDRAGKFLIPFSLFSMICLFAIWNPNHINYEPRTTLLLFGGALACTYISFGTVHLYSSRAEESLDRKSVV